MNRSKIMVLLVVLQRNLYYVVNMQIHQRNLARLKDAGVERKKLYLAVTSRPRQAHSSYCHCTSLTVIFSNLSTVFFKLEWISISKFRINSIQCDKSHKSAFQERCIASRGRQYLTCYIRFLFEHNFYVQRIT